MDLLVPIDGLKDSLTARHCSKQDVGLLSQHHHGVKQHAYELGEQHDLADRHAEIRDLARAVPDDDTDGRVG